MKICGIDEAGRGCLCGSMFVAGVICDEKMGKNLLEIGVKDSKMLSKNTRFELAKVIKSESEIYYHIIEKTAKEIDDKGLSTCLKECIEEIILKCLNLCSVFYMDGNTDFKAKIPSSVQFSTIVKGDSKIPQISAASILAKVAKDYEMQDLSKLYPGYGFNSNAGYASKKHIQAIRILGKTPKHRDSFVIKSIQPKLFE